MNMEHSPQPLISIIILVYNVEKYLTKCLDSVVGQTYTNLEIILVVKESSDRSEALCEQYASQDKRIKIIYKNDGNRGGARNAGVETARGEYISFVDGDDYVAPDYIEFLYTLITKGDFAMSICGRANIENGKLANVRNAPSEMRMTGWETLKMILYGHYFSGVCWGALYAKGFLGKVKFPADKMSEDWSALSRCLPDIQGRKIIFAGDIKYYCVLRPGSGMHNQYTEKDQEYLSIHEEIYQKIPEGNLDCKKAAAAKCASVAMRLLSKMYDDQKEKLTGARREMYQTIQKYRPGVLWDPNVSRKNKLIILLSYLPFWAFDPIVDWGTKITGQTMRKVSQQARNADVLTPP